MTCSPSCRPFPGRLRSAVLPPGSHTGSRPGKSPRLPLPVILRCRLKRAMNSLFDILLPKPLPDAWLQGLLFAAFTMHLLFVLFTLGTAILAVYFFIHFRWSGKPVELELDRRILRSFMAHKSLAVVLGIGPLLLIQVGFPVTFFTAVN